jgi:excisionase family DNA binding protein
MDKLMTLAEVAEMLGVPVATLYQWRYHGTGPRGIRVGRHVRYRAADVDAWLDDHASAKASDRRAV